MTNLEIIQEPEASGLAGLEGPPEFNFMRDASYAVEATSRHGSFAMYNVYDHQSSNMLADDIAKFTGMRCLRLYEVDCDINNAKVADVKSATEDVRSFIRSNEKIMGRQGMIVVRDLDRLVGANSPVPNSAQDEAYKTLKTILSEENDTLVCAFTKTKSGEIDKQNRMGYLLGSFAFKGAFGGQIDETQAQKLLAKMGYDEDGSSLIINEQRESSGVLTYKNLALPIEDSEITGFRQEKLAAA